MSNICDKCGEHVVDCFCKDDLKNKDIFGSNELLRVSNHVELLKQLEAQHPYIDFFHEGYICGFNAIMKALEKDFTYEEEDDVDASV